MNKIVIKLYVPWLEQEYDVKVPIYLTVGEAVSLFSKSISTLSDGKFCASGNEILCVKERNILLDYHHQLCEYGIQNGDQLVLI